MRDPRGRLELEQGRVIRKLLERLPADDFLHQPAARELVSNGLMVDFGIPDDLHISAPRLDWVSQPSEWCGAQLLDAARLTLDIADRALAAGFELKDASAWNVIFDGTVPVFCDHLSFERITRREWRALGQFARHFILPLLVARRSGLQSHVLLRMFRDGITPQLARRICGWRMLFSRAAPLMLASSTSASRAPAGRQEAVRRGRDTFHANLLRYCRFSLPSRVRPEQGGWSNYVAERHHYSASAIEFKLQKVRGWIDRLTPAWVLDLGANTGEFSLVAAKAGARVISLDSDHDSIQRLFLHAQDQPELARRIHPVVADLDDLVGGRGWRGREFPGLASRLEGQCDLVMMLGLVHHIIIACAIPVGEVAEFAAMLTRDTLILETVSEHDPMFLALSSQYGRTLDAGRLCGEAAQISAFSAHFDLVDRSSIPDSKRSLLLMKKRVA